MVIVIFLTNFTCEIIKNSKKLFKILTKLLTKKLKGYIIMPFLVKNEQNLVKNEQKI